MFFPFSITLNVYSIGSEVIGYKEVSEENVSKEISVFNTNVKSDFNVSKANLRPILFPAPYPILQELNIRCIEISGCLLTIDFNALRFSSEV